MFFILIYSVTDILVLSKPGSAQDASGLRPFGRDICPKSNDSYGMGTFNFQLPVSI